MRYSIYSCYATAFQYLEKNIFVVAIPYLLLVVAALCGCGYSSNFVFVAGSADGQFIFVPMHKKDCLFSCCSFHIWVRLAICWVMQYSFWTMHFIHILLFGSQPCAISPSLASFVSSISWRRMLSWTRVVLAGLLMCKTTVCTIVIMPAVSSLAKFGGGGVGSSALSEQLFLCFFLVLLSLFFLCF